ncbi:MAG: hypothetical protein WA450_08525, partial [Candidatus Acidiferrales bacterium]
DTPNNITSKPPASARKRILKLPQLTFGIGTADADRVDFAMLARRIAKPYDAAVEPQLRA